MYNRLDSIPACDRRTERQTDGQTDRQTDILPRHSPRYAYASRREKSSDFDLYTAADFELDERHVIKNEKVALDRHRVRQNVFLVVISFFDVTIQNLHPSVTTGSFDISRMIHFE